jgi:hypothetical protein
MNKSIINDWKQSKFYRKFQTYHPYLTYSNPLNECFVKPNGEQCKDLDADTEALFNIGREAYKRLPDDVTKEEFDQAYSCHWDFIDDLRQTFQDMYGDGKLRTVNDLGKEFKVNWATLEDNQIVDVAWQLLPKFSLELEPKEDSFIKGTLSGLLLFQVFHEIDNACIGLFMDGSDAIAAAIAASNALANLVAIESGNDRLREARRDMAYRAVLAKIAADPKQKEKAFIFQRWQEWQREPKRYKSKAAFARDMLDKCEHLTSQKKIEDWCREWEKSALSQHSEH